ncbi:MAG: endonuclease III [SAR324 cluster bacterium]|nr:endonuclease III [SAR324 cluster bacterium]
MQSRKINRLFQKLSDAIPEPVTELIHHNHFELLIAVILSAQATDKSVNKVTPELFARYPEPHDFLEAGEETVLAGIKTIGLAKTKSANIIKTCQMLVEIHGGHVPETREELEKLAGVGRKTANVILNTAFGVPVIAVDTHVFRVSNRTGLTEGKNPVQVEKQLMEAIPEKWKKDAHHFLVLHGRYVCKAKVPLCGQCPIVKECEFPEKVKEGEKKTKR